jgi:3-oxoacyl-(acyl-carrier-protein) synthase
MELKRVVITGMGALTPIGNNVADYWAGLLAGKSGAAPITLFDASKFKTQFACEVKNFDPGVYLDRKEARKLDRFSQLAIASCEEAVHDAGLKEAPGITISEDEDIVIARGVLNDVLNDDICIHHKCLNQFFCRIWKFDC